MYRRCLPHVKAMFLGYVMAILVFPPASARAQFTSDIWGGKIWTELVKHNIREDKNWIETIRFYVDTVQKAVEQIRIASQTYTSVTGILTNSEIQLARDDQHRRSLAKLGKTIKGIFDLNRRIRTLVGYSARGMKEIYKRMQNGILDPEADARDLFNYVQFYLGNISQAELDKIRQCADMDQQLRSWIEEKQVLETEVAVDQKQMNDLQTQLTQIEEGPPTENSPLVAKDLTIQLNVIRTRVLASQARIQDLKQKIEDRFETYKLTMDEREQLAKAVVDNLDMWHSCFQIKQEAIDAIDNYRKPKN